MKCPGIDFPLPDFFSLPGMATMDAGMEVYQTGIVIVQGVCGAHDLQLRVVNELFMLRITHFRPESLAFRSSLTNRSATSGTAGLLSTAGHGLEALTSELKRGDGHPST
jgi:hypothetical protein